jgi:hypothetical protein
MSEKAPIATGETAPRIASAGAAGSNHGMSRPAGPHDVGGEDAGPVDRREHDTAYWEWQIDAMIRLALAKGLISDFAELRDGIERLAPEDYERLSYYERWAKSLAWTLVDKGVIGQAELDTRVDAIGRRQAGEAAR